jgi:hypothetical protein
LERLSTSPFISLEDGESIVVKKLKDIKFLTKPGYAGEEKEVLRLKCTVETSEGDRDKDFDNGTQRFAEELQSKGVKVGSGFTITRVGEKMQTRYTISDVTSGAAPATAAIPTAPEAPATPKA